MRYVKVIFIHALQLKIFYENCVFSSSNFVNIIHCTVKIALKIIKINNMNKKVNFGNKQYQSLTLLTKNVFNSYNKDSELQIIKELP